MDWSCTRHLPPSPHPNLSGRLCWDWNSHMDYHDHGKSVCKTWTLNPELGKTDLNFKTDPIFILRPDLTNFFTVDA